MNQQSIKTFLAIAEHQSISAAARSLFTSQPSVSALLSNLEKELGVRLVLRERGARKVYLTSAGKDFLPLAQRCIDLESEIAQFKQSHNHSVLRVAASISGHEYIVSHIIHKMMRSYPDIELQISIIEGRELLSFIDEQKFDIAIKLGHPLEHPDAYTVPLFVEDRYILCPINTPYPDIPLSPSDLDPHFEVRYANFVFDKATKNWRDCFFPDNVKPYFDLDRLMIAHQYLTDPRCWTIIPAGMAIALVHSNPERFTLRRFGQSPPPPRPGQAMICRSYPDSHVIQKFLQCCRDYVEETPYLHLPPTDSKT